MDKRIFLSFLLFGLISLAPLQAQVGINILYPDTSAILHLESTDRGLLLPRMNTTQRDAIVDPKAGLVIYNNQDSTVQWFNGDCWLHTFQEDCDDCFFDMTPSTLSGTIDRVVTNTTSMTIDIEQNNGDPQNIAVAIVNALPLGVTADISPNPLFSTGTITITFEATTFSPDGTFPIIIQALCGGEVVNIIYSLTITPCYEVEVINSLENYDLSVELYAQNPSLNASIPVCVVSHINTGVTISSPDVTVPAYTTGNLHPSSVVAIVNDGNVIGKGGDGGVAVDPVNGLSGDGQNGGTAIDLTVNTDVLNNFNIYGGGGGGNAMAFSISFDLSTLGAPIPLPTLGIFLGGGGGGGAGNGQGGQIPATIGIPYYEPGTNGSGGQFGVNGVGGLLSTPIPFPIGPAEVTLDPYALGGDGGPYGYPGTVGVFGLKLDLSVVVTPPFGAPITIPIVSGIDIPIPVPTPLAGEGGFAIKRNGNTTNVPDNLYNNSNLKGQVGN